MLKRRLRASVCGVFCALACGMAHTTSFAKAYPEFGTTEPEVETLRWAWVSAQRYSGLSSRKAVDDYKRIPVYIVTPAQMEQDVCANDPANACSATEQQAYQAQDAFLWREGKFARFSPSPEFLSARKTVVSQWNFRTALG